MSNFSNKKILIVGGVGSGKEELVNKIIEKEKNYILYEDLTSLRKIKGILKKFDYKTIIVSTNKLNNILEIRNYDYVLFLKNRNRTTIDLAKEIGIKKIEELEFMEFKMYKKDLRKEAEDIVKKYKGEKKWRRE